MISLISVGAGTAGCVLANRLSEDPDNKVLLLEAGGEEIHIEGLNIPMTAQDYQRSSLDWSFATVSQEVACGSYDRQVKYYNIQNLCRICIGFIMTGGLPLCLENRVGENFFL